MADTSLKQIVEDDVAKVKSAMNRALFLLATSVGSSSTQSNNAANGIRSLQPSVDTWAKRGRDAANGDGVVRGVDGKPTANGWPGWKAAGQNYVTGFGDLKDTANKYLLADIKSTVKEAPATTAKATKAVAKKAADVATKAAVAVGETAVSGLKFGALGLAGAGAVALVALTVFNRATR